MGTVTSAAALSPCPPFARVLPGRPAALAPATPSAVGGIRSPGTGRPPTAPLNLRERALPAPNITCLAQLVPPFPPSRRAWVTGALRDLAEKGGWIWKGGKGLGWLTVRAPLWGSRGFSPPLPPTLFLCCEALALSVPVCVMGIVVGPGWRLLRGWSEGVGAQSSAVRVCKLLSSPHHCAWCRALEDSLRKWKKAGLSGCSSSPLYSPLTFVGQ